MTQQILNEWIIIALIVLGLYLIADKLTRFTLRDLIKQKKED